MIPYLHTPVKLIAIHGKAGTGKDTINDYLHEKYFNCWHLPFADALKDAASHAFGLPLDCFNNQNLKEQEHPYWKTTPRKIAQFFGTEMFRDKIKELIPHVGDDFWVMRHAGTIDGWCVREDDPVYDKHDTIVIPDLRFQNEYQYVTQNNGIVIHLTRPGKDGTVGILGHQSEAGIHLNRPELTYEVLNDGTLEQLYAKVDEVISQSNLNIPLKSADFPL